MNGVDPASGGADAGVGTPPNYTPTGYPPARVRGAVVALLADPALVALDLIERCGPTYARHLVEELLALVGEAS